MRTPVVLLLAGSVAGCAADAIALPPASPINWRSFDVAAARPSDAPGPTAKERAITAAYAAALAAPSLTSLVPLLDENAHFAFPGRSDLRGRDQVLRAHEVLFGAFDHRKTAVTRVWRTESTQAIEWSLAGVQAREWMGVPAKQKPVVMQGVTLLWTQDDGTISDVHVYFDVAAVKAQLGVGPKELQALALRSPPPAGGSEPGEPLIVEQAKSPDETANVAIVRAALGALEENKEAAFLATMATDVEVRSPSVSPAAGRVPHGGDEARVYFKTMRKAIGQLDTTVKSAWAAGSFVVVEYLIAGEQNGPIGFVPKTHDRAVRLEIVDVIEMREGRMARIWRYWNPDAIMGDP